MDIIVVYFLNNLAGVNNLLDSLFIFLSTNLFLVMWLIFIVFLIATYDRVSDPLILGKRVARNLVELRVLDYKMIGLVFVASGVSYIFNQIIGAIWFRERPFLVVEGVTKLIEKSAFDKSFPSDHTTLAFALAFSVFIYDKRWGSIFLVLATILGLSRVVVGVHYLTDIFGGVLMAAVIVWVTYRVGNMILKRL